MSGGQGLIRKSSPPNLVKLVFFTHSLNFYPHPRHQGLEFEGIRDAYEMFSYGYVITAVCEHLICFIILPL